MAANYDDNREVTFEIVEEIGVISTTATGWTKELNVVAWNGNQGKYDIREWAPRHDRMGRGITLNEQEMRAIVNLLKRRERLVPRGISTAQSSQDSGFHDVDNGFTETESEVGFDTDSKMESGEMAS